MPNIFSRDWGTYKEESFAITKGHKEDSLLCILIIGFNSEPLENTISCPQQSLSTFGGHLAKHFPASFAVGYGHPPEFSVIEWGGRDMCSQAYLTEISYV